MNISPLSSKPRLISNRTQSHPYSNSGYFLLGLIIEKLTGKPYEEALKERITSKIGLKDTYTATGNIDVNKNESLTYFNLGGDWKQVPETHPSILFSAGAIVSTPNDLAKFIQALFDGKIVSKESLDQMKTMRDGEGLGMVTFTFAGKTFYGHAGGADNYGAWLAYLPEEKLAVAYTTNAKVYPVKDIVQRRCRHLLQQAVSDSRLRIHRRQPGSAGQIRRSLFEPGSSREIYDHQRRRDALRSTARSANPLSRSKRQHRINFRSITAPLRHRY